jgi:hypothetical protein
VRATFTDASYLCAAYAKHYDWDDRSLQNFPPGADPARIGTRTITEELLIWKERRGFALFDAMTTTVDLSGANRQWNESAATETVDIQAIKTAVRLGTMKGPGMGRRLVMVAGGEVDDYLKGGDLTAGTAGANILSKVGGVMNATGTAITNTMLASYFSVDEYIPALAVHNDANPGQTQANDYIWGDMIVVALVDETPTLESITTGWTFATKGLVDGFMQWSEPNIGHGGQRLEGEHISVPKIVSTAAFGIIKDVLG